MRHLHILPVLGLLLSIQSAAWAAPSMWDAAAQGDVAQVKQAMLLKGDVNATEPVTGRTLLIAAVTSTNVEMVKELLDAGAGINAMDARGRTALYAAAWANRPAMVRLLLDRGADPNRYSHPAHPPLTAACVQDDLEMARWMLKAGADPNAASPVGWTPMHEMAFQNKVKAIAFLVEAGAQVSPCTRFGETPLMIATGNGADDAVTALLKAGANVNESNLDSSTLTRALRFGHFSTALLLVEAGYDLKQKTTFDGPPLTYALAAGQLDLARHMIERGAEMPKYDSGVREATLKGHTDCVKWAMQQGATFTSYDWDDLEPKLLAKSDAKTYAWLVRELLAHPPVNAGGLAQPVNMTEAGVQLVEAASAGDAAKVKELLAAGENKNTPGLTIATSYALQEGRIDVLRVLQPVQQKAATTERNRQRHQSALVEACQKGDVLKVKQYLSEGVPASQSKSSSGQSPIFAAVRGGHVEIVQSLLDAGASPRDDTGFMQMSPLSVASKYGKAEVTRVLLERGANPNQLCEGELYSPLHVAADAGHRDVVQALLGHADTDVNLPSVRHTTALMVAAKNGRVEIVQLLLDHGAKADLRNDDGKSAMDFAQVEHQDAVVQMLAKATGETVTASPTSDQGTPLITGLTMPPPERVRELLAKGVDPNKPGPASMPTTGPVYPLQVPIYMGEITKDRLDIIRMLLNAGANPNVPEGVLAHVAGNTEEGREVVRLLVKAGADINRGDPIQFHGATPLAVAAVLGDVDHVKLLLELGADPTKLNDVGKDAITLAKESQYINGLKKSRIVEQLQKAVTQWRAKHGQTRKAKDGGQ
ncbi:MAG: ankyrin repeat domain-containing protein [Phycisphaeraceae bacterium]|nr:ankyrin repeat domain-containing protein [Phycisphaeraceae bacterium]